MQWRSKLSRALYLCASIFIVCALQSVAVADTSGPIDPFPVTGAVTALHREDRNNISIIEFGGNYDQKLPNGSLNLEPRAVIAREFYRTHPDHYDFIMVFSNFEFNTGDARAFHLGVQNKVQGIGLKT